MREVDRELIPDRFQPNSVSNQERKLIVSFNCKSKMKMYLIQIISLLMTIFHTVDSAKYLQQDKRSVFDILMNTDGENKDQHFEISKYANLLNKISGGGKSFKYQNFMNIFHAQKPKHRGERLVYEMKRQEIKKLFLKSHKWRNKKKFKERRP